MPDDAGNGLTPATSCQKIATCVTKGNSVAGPHTMYVKSGTYSDLIELADSDWVAGTIIGVKDLNTLAPADFDEVKNITATTHGLHIGVVNVTVKNLTLQATSASKYPFYSGLSGWTLEHCKIYDSPGYMAYITGGSGWTIKNCLFQGTDSYSVYISGATSGTILNSIIKDSDTKSSGPFAAIINAGTGTLYLDNSNISGVGMVASTYGLVRQTGASPGSIIATNNIIGPTNIGDYLFHSANGSIVYDYNILIPDMYAHRIATGPVTDGGHNIVTANPGYTRRERSGIISFNVDDTGANRLAYVQAWETLLSSHGWKGTWFPEYYGIESDPGTYVQPIKDMVARGTVETGGHTYSHTDLTKTTAMTCTKSGGNIQVDVAGNQIIATPGGTITGINSRTLGYNGVAGTIIYQLNAWGYTCVLTTGILSNVSGGSLGNVNGSTTSGLALPLLIDTTANTGFFYYEIKKPKADMEAALSTTLRSFSTPFGIVSANAKLAIKASGFESERVYYALADTGGRDLSAIDLYNLEYLTHATYKGASDVELVNNMHALCQFVSAKGVMLSLLAHNVGELTIDQWALVMNVVAQYPEIYVGSMAQITDKLKASPWTYDNGTGISTRSAWVDQANYSLRPTSPAIDVGSTAPGLTSDYAGNPIYGTPDIGAYEYQPPYDMGAHEVDISANVRVYGDGKFRNTETAEGTTADLSVIPQSSQTTKWLDIIPPTGESSLIWEINHKKWKESSTTLGATDTLHTVGDLTAGKSYSLKIDNVLATANITGTDCVAGICTADGTNQITFTYTGGYSDHTFDLIDDVAPVLVITPLEADDIVSGDDTFNFTDSEETDPQCSLNDSDYESCDRNSTSFSQIPGWDDIAESDTFTLYMKDTDASTNTGTTSMAGLVKADTEAPIRYGGSPEGEQASSTTSTILSLTTTESATCKYGTVATVPYADMTGAFADVGGTTHSATLSGLTSGNTYNYYVRCQDESENANDTDYLISFSIATPNTDENTDNNTDDKKDLNLHDLKSSSTQDSITLTWKTDHNTKSSIRYGTDRNLKEKKKDSQKEKKHTVVLKDLLPNTKYYFRIKATDSDDNEDSSSIHSIMTKPVPNSNANLNPTSNENTNQAPIENTTTSSPSYSGNPTSNICSYTVASGDTLWSIAKKVYGDATAYSLIIDKNKDTYADIENKLNIGQELTFCDNNQNSQTTGNNSNADNSGQQNQIQSKPEIKTSHWWNPFTWF